MPVPAMASGANVFIDEIEEASFGIVPGASGWFRQPAFDFGLQGTQNFLDEPLLGSGRDPLASIRGAVNVAGSVGYAIDQRHSGRIMRKQFGAPESSTQIGARGHIDFDVNPTAGDTITLNGVAWEFVAAGATGPQTDIGASLAATVTALAVDLNASVDADLAVATYTANGSRLEIRHDTADATGNAYTLATDIASAGLSGATLVGGGLYEHIWHSAAATLPTTVFQTFHADWDNGSARYPTVLGCMQNDLQLTLAREGAARFTCSYLGREETFATASQSGTPTEYTIDLFSQFEGVVLLDGAKLATLVGGDLTISNSLVATELFGDEGRAGKPTPGRTAVSMSLQARFADDALFQAARNQTQFDMRVGYFSKTSGAELTFRFHNVQLPLPTRPIGDGPITATYEARGAKSVAVGRAITAWLINDVASY